MNGRVVDERYYQESMHMKRVLTLKMSIMEPAKRPEEENIQVVELSNLYI